ncbi:hypothetical protein DPMN_111184 [Dreissena polymorpha]|uniref:Uncharacterized protein n=1 Tax=Dreissena polymorpha TaxID=45954 RepID=A0A9D4KDZ3_DREPO|nr:hypothetical protein DPMN_111184 [Dreissena polymorpha]
MARQRPTRIPTPHGLTHGRPRLIDRIVIREFSINFEVNRCRNEEIKVKGNFGYYRIFIREVQYQFEVNRCRNEEIIVKGYFGGSWPMWAGAPHSDMIALQFLWGTPGLVMGPCIVEIDRIVIREVQYQFEDNRCRNEEIIRPTRAPRLKIDCIVIREVQYQLEVNRLKRQFGWVWPMWVGRPRVGMGPCIIEIDCIVIKEVQYQFEVNRLKGNFGWAGLHYANP